MGSNAAYTLNRNCLINISEKTTPEYCLPRNTLNYIHMGIPSMDDIIHYGVFIIFFGHFYVELCTYIIPKSIHQFLSMWPKRALILTCANVNWFIYVAYSLIEYTRGLTHFCNLYSNSLIVAESNWMCCWTFPVVLSQTGLKIQNLKTTYIHAEVLQ